MSTEDEPAGTLRFGVDARHIRQLGQELVGDRVTAVTELIKNSYDADATQVVLRFDQSDKAGGRLEVCDDGRGMDLAALTAGWMRISTAGKENESISPRYGRTRAGRKGIGRFATETLGRKLTLSTTTAGSTQRLVVEFDWEHAYPEGRELTVIDNPYFVEDATEAEHGTVLRIEGLYDVWNDAARDRIKKAVRLLQPPFPVVAVEMDARNVPHSAADASPAGEPEYEPDPGFAMKIVVDGAVDSLREEGFDEFLAAATAQVVASIDDDGVLTVHVSSKRLGLDVKETLTDRFPGAGPFSLQASYFIFRPEMLGGVSRKIASAMADKYSGIRVYRDGLRVMPYGEPDNDWLALDELSASRSEILAPVASQNWFGQVEISRSANPGLRDTASREGFVVTPAFWVVRAAIREALKKTASEVAAIRNKKTKASDRRPQPTREEIVKQARDEIAAAAEGELPPVAAAQVMNVVDRALNLASADARTADRDERERVESLLGEVELLRILASLGTSIAVFSHEVKAALNAATGALAVIAKRSGDDEPPELADARRALTDLTELSAYIDAYVSLSQRRERQPQPLSAVLRDFVHKLSVNLARSVEFDVTVDPLSLRTEPMARSELESALINLLTNAVKAMDAEGGQRRISIRATGDDGEVVLRFQDTGTGVKPDIADRIFEPFISDSSSNVSELGSGTGLGLKIVRDIAEDNGGSIGLVDADSPFRTCFELRLPRWAQQDGTRD